MDTLKYGGGMNAYFEADSSYELKDVPWKFEAGTQNIVGVIGLGKAIDYLNSIGLDKIHEYEFDLKRFAISELEKIPNITIYNKNTDSGIVVFNIDKVFSQDTAIYLDKYNICVRAGNHCAKILKDVFNIANTCRISLSFYNTRNEIDLLINVLKNSKNIWEEIL